MENNLYIDTNIFIDLLDSTRPSYITSLALVKKSLEAGKVLYINSDTVTNAFYILNKLRRGKETELMLMMKKVVMLFEVVSIDDKDVIDAFDLCINTALEYKDYEDAVQYVCAKKIEADLIVTNDKMFVSFDIEICSTMS